MSMAENLQVPLGNMSPGAPLGHIIGEQEGEFNLVGLVRRLWNAKTMVMLPAVVVCLIAIVATVIMGPRYTSTAAFIPPGTSGGSGAAAALAGQLSSIGVGSLLGTAKTPADLYVGILKSRSIASELVKRFDLMAVYKVKKESKAEQRLADNSRFEVDLKDSIVTISVIDKSPARAHDLANAYLDALRETNSRLALSEASQRRLFFGQQLAREKDELADAEVDLKRTEEQTGFIAPAGQTASEIQTSAQTRAEISLRQVELSALRQSSTDQNPEVVRLQTEIASLQGQLSRLHSGSEDSEGGVIPTSKVPAIALDYIRKAREVKYHETLFEMLARQYESARLDEAHEGPLLQILDPASYPDSRSGPPRALIAFGGLLLGLIAGSAWVLLREQIFVSTSTKRSQAV